MVSLSVRTEPSFTMHWIEHDSTGDAILGDTMQLRFMYSLYYQKANQMAASQKMRTASTIGNIHNWQRPQLATSTIWQHPQFGNIHNWRHSGLAGMISTSGLKSSIYILASPTRYSNTELIICFLVYVAT